MNYRIVIEEREDIVKRRPRPYQENEINCYTDGSKMLETTGSGFILMSKDFKEQNSIPLGPEATVFQAEITAIYDATTTLLKRKVSNYNIHINVDSQAALKALDNFATKNLCVTDCKQALNRLASYNNKIELKWIPGHEGHLGNEIADRLAKRGAEMEIEGPRPLLPISYTIIRTRIKEWEKEKHFKMWEMKQDCRQTKMFLPKPNNNWAKEILKLNKKDIRLIIQILTGHNTLRRHKFLMGLEPSAICEGCEEEEETSEHFLLRCPLFALERYQILGNDFLAAEDIQEMKISKIKCFISSTARLEQQE
jgi:ribonuclease HI